MTLFYGYCLTLGPDPSWTPKVLLSSPMEAWGYCALHHGRFPEIIITDENHCCVIHVKAHIAYLASPGDMVKCFDLQHKTVLDDIPVAEIPP